MSGLTHCIYLMPCDLEVMNETIKTIHAVTKPVHMASKEIMKKIGEVTNINEFSKKFNNEMREILTEQELLIMENRKKKSQQKFQKAVKDFYEGEMIPDFFNAANKIIDETDGHITLELSTDEALYSGEIAELIIDTYREKNKSRTIYKNDDFPQYEILHPEQIIDFHIQETKPKFNTVPGFVQGMFKVFSVKDALSEELAQTGDVQRIFGATGISIIKVHEGKGGTETDIEYIEDNLPENLKKRIISYYDIVKMYENALKENIDYNKYDLPQNLIKKLNDFEKKLKTYAGP